MTEPANRMRLDPRGELQRLSDDVGISTSGTPSVGNCGSSSRPSLTFDPVAGNFRLDRAADDGHVDWMLQMDCLGHTGSGGSDAGVRMIDEAMTAIDAQGTSPFAEQARTLVFKTTLKYYIATSLGVMFTGPIYWSMICVRSALERMQTTLMA